MSVVSVVVLHLLLFLYGVNSYCTIYGQCHYDEERDALLNCYYEEGTKKAEPLNKTAETYEEALKQMKSYCPYFFYDDEGNEKDPDDVEFCCDINQVFTMVEGLTMASPFARCPTCHSNLVYSICDFTCSSEQHKFVSAAVVEEEGNLISWPYAKELNVFMDRDYMTSIYDSCKGVSSPSTGGLLLDAVCGSYGATYCTAERLFEYLGNPDENPLTPYRINYIPTENNSDALLRTTFPCNEAYEGSQSCSCVDCSLSCIGNEFEALDQGFSIWSMNGYGFICAILLFCAGLSFTIYIYIRNRNYTEKESQEERGSTRKDACIGDNVDRIVENAFRKWSRLMAKYRVIVLCVSSWIIAGFSAGMLRLEITTNPVELWASPNSQSRLEKDFFDSNFKPFYRTEQIFIKTVGIPEFEYESTGGTVTMGPAFNKSFLLTVFELQKEIEKIGNSSGYGLETICYAPMLTAFNKLTINSCTVMSLLGLFGNDIDNFIKMTEDNTYLNTLITCLQNPYSVLCLAPYGGPIQPQLAVGGGVLDNYTDSTGIGLTFLVNNQNEASELEPALKWEEDFIAFLKEWEVNEKPDYMDIAYSSERSIEDEIERLSFSEIRTIVISYLIMFLYISIALGRIFSCKDVLLESKVSLAFGGILIVIFSVLCSIGVCSLFGVATTLLTIEVVPFLVLAVGVDNIFIIVQTCQRNPRTKDQSLEDYIGNIMAKVGPSILLTSSCEIGCFAVGSWSDMPAVNTFAIYATVAMTFNFILQTTTFVALLTVDQSRYRSNRFDIICCAKLSKPSENRNKPGWLYTLWTKYYTPFIMRFNVRCFILFVFSVTTAVSVALVPNLSLGLDQELSMPDDSHVLKYFQYMSDLMTIGAPIYWVVKGPLDYTNTTIQNIMCGGVGCSDNSLTVQLYTASQQSDITYIATQPTSWIDDFKDWSETSSCCKYFYSNNSFCPHTYSNTLCGSCAISNFPNMSWDEYFEKYLSYFLNDNPDSTCAKGGHASYADGINYYLDEEGKANITSSSVMSYHTVLRGSENYYEALKYARIIADNLTKTLDTEEVEVFPYSIFYVFYEQYLTIWPDTLQAIGLSIFVVACGSFIFGGLNLFSTFIITLIVFLTVLHLACLMYLWNITLNAISLVNLVMAMGIAVEFCGHIVHSFEKSTADTAIDRATEALAEMGSSVLSGITLTKFCGIIVLAFASSQIFKVYYFRMYFGIVIIGALLGLVLLPVLLSIFGALKYPNNSVRKVKSEILTQV